MATRDLGTHQRPDVPPRAANVPGVRQPVLDRHVDVAQLWRLAREAAGKGEKWGQRKKSVSDAMLGYYSHLRLDRRGAKQWVATS